MGESKFRSPVKKYAIRFKPGSEGPGTLIIISRGPGVGLKGGIFLIDQETLEVLDKEKLEYEKFEIDTTDVSEILREAQQKGWF